MTVAVEVGVVSIEKISSCTINNPENRCIHGFTQNKENTAPHNDFTRSKRRNSQIPIKST